MSGLHVNPSKSQVILSKSVGRKGSLTGSYGLPRRHSPYQIPWSTLVASRLTIADCQPLLHKIDSRLVGWVQHNLSLAGRTQLIRSVLSTLHIYWASVFILPKSVISIIQQQMRPSMAGLIGTRLCKVSWAQVCKPKEEGGLGIRRVLHMNQALMMKYVWRVLQDTNQPGSLGYCCTG
ncbi:UNVERIFIED_CONTAM: hypothetical protein Slati_0889200 [Sesamum latifolium]|uniref:Reverse transcriptase n=1 Tax=Sesamum latifolium TaxID=2727402 RepID=A0AAW2XN76_9LAMI